MVINSASRLLVVLADKNDKKTVCHTQFVLMQSSLFRVISLCVSNSSEL
jgi:hypothetical protein